MGKFMVPYNYRSDIWCKSPCRQVSESLFFWIFLLDLPSSPFPSSARCNVDLKKAPINQSTRGHAKKIARRQVQVSKCHPTRSFFRAAPSMLWLLPMLPLANKKHMCVNMYVHVCIFCCDTYQQQGIAPPRKPTKEANTQSLAFHPSIESLKPSSQSLGPSKNKKRPPIRYKTVLGT